MKAFLISLLLGGILFSQPLREFRAVKITDVDSYVLFSDANIAKAMDYLASINVNVVLPVVWNGGYTNFQSETMETLFGSSINPKFTGRDPLKRLIIEAHKNGIEVLPWFEYGFAAWYSGGTPPFGGHILQKYPEWALRTSDGNICTKNGFDWMNAINPDVQDFINSLVEEVITNYDVDGVEFSDRIPALPIEGGYDSTTVAIYKAEHNDAAPPADYTNAAWKRWRADKMNEWYVDVKNLVKDHDPNLFVSSSPSIYPWAYDNYLQDSKTWVDEDIVDHIIPQLYRYSFNEYLYELNIALSYVPLAKRDRFFSAILMNIGTGSNAYVMTPDYLKKAMKANRDRNVMGEAFFYYEGLRKNNDQLGDTLLATYYKDFALVPGRNGARRPKAYISDENQEGNFISGNWEDFSGPGYGGSVYTLDDPDNSSSLIYRAQIKESAWYNVYFHNSPSFNFTDSARFVLKPESANPTEIIFDQSSNSNSGWTFMGTEYFDSSSSYSVVSLDNSYLSSGDILMADAIMLTVNRKLSPDVVMTYVEKEISPVVPSGFHVYQNYPNPFNPSTTLRFYNDAQQNIKVDIYDILGRRIKTITDDFYSVGEQTIKFHAENLSSGIYVYVISTPAKQHSGKMLLMK